KPAALGALRQLDPDDAAKALLKALDSKIESIRAWACQQMTTKDKQVSEALVKVLKRETSVVVRRAVAGALSSQADAESAKALIEALRDGDAEVRAAAASSLGYRREQSAREELER